MAFAFGQRPEDRSGRPETVDVRGAAAGHDEPRSGLRGERMRPNLVRRAGVPLALSLTLLAACGGGAPAGSGGGGGGAQGAPKLQTVTMGTSSAGIVNAGEYLAEALGFFHQHGIDVQFVNFNSASEVVPALATQRVDVAALGVNPAMFNAMSKGLGIKLVADHGSGRKGFALNELVVRKDLADRIKGPADLKGRNVALTPPGLGTSSGFLLSTYLAQAHLTPKDLHIQPIAFPEQVAALSNKAVDAAIMVEPFATLAVRQGVGVRLLTLDDVAPHEQIAVLAFGGRFIQQHRDLAVRFLEGYIQGERAYDAAVAQGVDRQRVIQIMSQQTHIRDLSLWQEMIPVGLDPDGKLSEQSIQTQEDFFHRIGLIAEAPPLSQFVDLSLEQDALKALGSASKSPQ